jgi:hypothetical protein
MMECPWKPPSILRSDIESFNYGQISAVGRLHSDHIAQLHHYAKPTSVGAFPTRRDFRPAFPTHAVVVSKVVRPSLLFKMFPCLYPASVYVAMPFGSRRHEPSQLAGGGFSRKLSRRASKIMQGPSRGAAANAIFRAFAASSQRRARYAASPSE